MFFEQLGEVEIEQVLDRRLASVQLLKESIVFQWFLFNRFVIEFPRLDEIDIVTLG